MAQQNDQEIDLTALREKLDSVFDNINTGLFRMVQFGVRNAIWILILLIVGAGLGFYLDRTQKTYNNELIVTPNFGSVDYLYDKVGLIEAKIKEKDRKFLAGIGIRNPKGLLKISIEPITDIYGLVNRSTVNFEMVKLMAEDSDMKSIAEDPMTSKNFNYHKITLITEDKTKRDEVVQPLLDYLNNSAHYAKLQQEYVRNLNLKMQANEETIDQINLLLEKFASSEGKNPNMFYYSENTQLNDVLKTKDELIREQGNMRIDAVGMDRIVKESSVLTNIEDRKSLNGKMKFALPVLFVLLFVLVKLFRAFYKKQSLRAKKA